MLAAGKLLVDVRNSTGEATTPFNGDAGSSVVGRVFTSTGGSLSDATGTVGGGSGLVTFCLLPEPGGGAEALAAGAALAWLRRRRARREL